MGSTIVTWISSVLGAAAGKIVGVMFISMLPVIELRGAIPVAFALGVDWRTAMLCAIIGNVLPIPFILIFLEYIFAFMKNHNICKNMVIKLEKRAASKNANVSKYSFWGLAIFVAIPLPGTGGWTGALIASVMKMDKKSAFLSILLGVLLASVLISALTYGLVGFFI